MLQNIEQADGNSRMNSELLALSFVHHPYIEKLAYATQSESLALLYAPVPQFGNLDRALVGGALAVGRVQFYAAEILSALFYLHKIGLMHRNLKPANVVLRADGHISLGGFDSVGDMNGCLEGREFSSCTRNLVTFESLHSGKTDVSSANPITYSSHISSTNHIPGFSHVSSASFNSSSGRVPNANHSFTQPSKLENQEEAVGRLKTLVGTPGYMAPEMAIMFAHRVLHKDGYTAAVDWWGLGVLIYCLMTATEPFSHVDHKHLQVVILGLWTTSSTYAEVFSVLFGNVDYFKPGMTAEAQSLIQALLQILPSNRLGYKDPSGHCLAADCELRSHPFFKGINWESVESGVMTPPYLPSKSKKVANLTSSTSSQPKIQQGAVPTINEFLVARDKVKYRDLVTGVGPARSNRASPPVSHPGFSDWCFVHPELLES